MVESKDAVEPTLPSKRKPDLSREEEEEHPNKTQKLQTLKNNSQLSEDKTQEPDKKYVNSDAEEDNNDDDSDDDDEDGVDGNGKAAVVDRKGKGILLEDDDEDESDDDDDDSDGGSLSDGDSDLSDDPLAEVDLDNILPARTRRRVIQPGEFVSNDPQDDDDSDSDEDGA